ncbi:MAG: IPT/TIG domain-containing protein [Planctomycetales bacterium]|nr:IPT/TIG domain-containing protein [Planctomycetales bacterium]
MPRSPNDAGLTVVALPPPALTGVSPSYGPFSGGQTVTLTGTNFGAGAVVSFGGTAATSVAVLAATSLTCVTPAHTAGLVSVTVTNPDGQTGSLAGAYSFVSASVSPTLWGVSPRWGPMAGGTSVTVTGSNFLAGATVSFAGAAAGSLSVVSTSQILCVTPAGPIGPATIVVTNPDGQTVTGSSWYGVFVYRGPTPTLASVSPTSEPMAGGNAITLTGTNFYAGATVTVGGNSAPGVNVVSSTQATAVIPAGANGPSDVVLRNVDYQWAILPSGFNYTGPAPTVTSITPATGPTIGGRRVAIAGTSFFPGATVAVGGTAASAVVAAAPSTIFATVPPGVAGPATVTVTNRDGRSGSLANGYTYVAASLPAIVSLFPATGSSLGGEAVTISGAGFASGATVSIGGALATSVGVPSTTTITCTTPSGSAGAASVTVVNPDGSSGALAGAYLFAAPAPVLGTPPPPTVVLVTPGNGDPAGGTPITIVGSGFLPGATVLVGGIGATQVVFWGPAMLTALAPAGAGLGPVNVVVTNPNGQNATLANGFFYVPGAGAPTVTAVNPSTGGSAGGTTVTITGSNIQAGALVAFGGVTAAAGTLTGTTQLVVTAPAEPPGTGGSLPVTVVNPGGAAASLAGAFTYQAVPVAGASSVEADIAVDGSGIVHVVWGGVSYSRSTDGGQTWSAPATSLSPSGTRPRLAARGSTVVVVWGDGAGGVLHAVSTDNGQTWSAGTLLAYGGATDAALDSNARLVVVYEPQVPTSWVSGWGQTLTFWSSVGVAGLSGPVGGPYGNAVEVWDARLQVTSYGPPVFSPCVAADGNGLAVAAWTEVWDLWTVRSTDGGATYSPARRLVPAGTPPRSHGVGLSGSTALITYLAPGALHGAAPAAGAPVDLRIIRSSDGGGSWAPSRSVGSGWWYPYDELWAFWSCATGDGTGMLTATWIARPGQGSGPTSLSYRSADGGVTFAGRFQIGGGLGIQAAGAGGRVFHAWPGPFVR